MQKRRRRRRILPAIMIVIVLVVLVLIVDSYLGKMRVQKTVDAAVIDLPTTSASTIPEPTAPLPEAEAENRTFEGELTARCAVLLNGNGKVLFSKREDSKAYPASTTKVLTALVAIENGNLADIIRVGDEANMPKPGSSIAGLRYGEKFSLKELLNALMIPSGNDAAYVIAAYVGRKTGGEDLSDKAAVKAFIALMNKRAEELGATNSHFTIPDGFHEEEHYTTALDMARIAAAAMVNDTFAQIVSKRQYKLPDVKGKDKDGKEQMQKREFTNTNELLNPSSKSYLKSCTGIKTGYTGEAGFCLVSSASEGDKTVIAVVFDSTKEDVWQDARALLVWGLSGQ